MQILDSHNWCCNVPVDPVIRNVTTTSLEPKNVTRVVNTTYERTCEFGEQPTSADGWKCADTVTHVMYVNRTNIHEREITRVRYNLSFKIFGRFGKLNKPYHYSNVLWNLYYLYWKKLITSEYGIRETISGEVGERNFYFIYVYFISILLQEQQLKW